MNDPTYVEAARHLAASALQANDGDTATRLNWLYRQVLQRAPTDREHQVLEAFVARNLAVYQQAPEEAAQLGAIGLQPAPTEVNAVELATWTCAARVILNLHETITRF